jgi:hypothetical protein
MTDSDLRDLIAYGVFACYFLVFVTLVAPWLKRLHYWLLRRRG